MPLYTVRVVLNRSLFLLILLHQGGDGEQGQQYKVLSAMWCLEDSRCITPRYSSWHTRPDQHLLQAKNWEQRLKMNSVSLFVSAMCSTATASSQIHPTRTGWSTWDNQEQKTALWGFLTWDAQTAGPTCSTSSPATLRRRCLSRAACSCWWQVRIFNSLFSTMHVHYTWHVDTIDLRNYLCATSSLYEKKKWNSLTAYR